MTTSSPRALQTTPFSAAQDEALRRMIRERMSLHEIGQRLNRAESDIARRTAELGLTVPPR